MSYYDQTGGSIDYLQEWINRAHMKENELKNYQKDDEYSSDEEDFLEMKRQEEEERQRQQEEERQSKIREEEIKKRMERFEEREKEREEKRRELEDENVNYEDALEDDKFYDALDDRNISHQEQYISSEGDRIEPEPYISSDDDNETLDFGKIKSSTTNILALIGLKKDVYVVLDPELCEIIPYNCKKFGVQLYTLIFEISISPIKYIRLKDAIINDRKISESYPYYLMPVFGRSYMDAIDTINSYLFYTNPDYFDFKLSDLSQNTGLIQSEIIDGNVYNPDTNIFMIQTRVFVKNNRYTLILDFNRESQKNEINDVLYPEVTVTKCNREDSTNHCEGLTEITNCKKINCRISKNTRSRAATRLQSRFRGNRARTLKKNKP